MYYAEYGTWCETYLSSATETCGSSFIVVIGVCIALSESAVMEGPERLDRDDRRDTDHGTGTCAFGWACCWHQSFKNRGSNFTRVGGRQYSASDGACLAEFLALAWPQKFWRADPSNLNGE
jgi:hypothetical protein